MCINRKKCCSCWGVKEEVGVSMDVRIPMYVAISDTSVYLQSITRMCIFADRLESGDFCMFSQGVFSTTPTEKFTDRLTLLLYFLTEFNQHDYEFVDPFRSVAIYIAEVFKHEDIAWVAQYATKVHFDRSGKPARRLPDYSLPAIGTYTAKEVREEVRSCDDAGVGEKRNANFTLADFR